MIEQRQTLKELVLEDPVTGERESCGFIAKKRTIGEIDIYLTYDEPNCFWWIVWQDGRLHKVGFHEDRNEECWQLFVDLNDSSLAKLRPS